MKINTWQAGLWIRIHFFADPDQAVFLYADPDLAAVKMLIWIRLQKICGKNSVA